RRRSFSATCGWLCKAREATTSDWSWHQISAIPDLQIQGLVLVVSSNAEDPMLRRHFIIGAVGFSAFLPASAPAEDASAGPVITLRRANGTAFPVDATHIERIRAWAPGDELPAGTTRVDWLALDYATEDLGTVVKAVLSIVPSFKSLRSPIGGAVWFDARRAIGPLPVLDKQVDPQKVRSVVRIGTHLQYLASTPDEVVACIRSAGGYPLVPGVAAATREGNSASSTPLTIWTY
ncbi:MAG TPA: hypothetical protein VHZ56_03215, partial [Devosia sp.]|nr:hypothetical protein [Devosia sp.]